MDGLLQYDIQRNFYFNYQLVTCVSTTLLAIQRANSVAIWQQRTGFSKKLL
jgi:hypothetical protein